VNAPRNTWRRVKVSLVREQGEAYTMRRRIRTGRDAASFLQSYLGNDPRERFAVIYLDTRHCVIGTHDAHIGTATGSWFHPREVFCPAVALAATAIIAAHNHPSGDPTPSAEDRAVTERLQEAGKIMGIDVLDHIVMGTERYYSFAEQGFFPHNASNPTRQPFEVTP